MTHTLGLALCFLMACASPPRTVDTTAERDEQTVQQWYDDWIVATKQGDLPLALSLIADDAVFLVPGVGTMGKQSFAAAATASAPNIEFELDASVREIQVLGDHAWVWAQASLSMLDKSTQARSRMGGHSLSILKRQGDRWVLVRDANTMVMAARDG